MSSPICELAIAGAFECGNAILKFISPNDVGLTGGHQCGFYLPKSAWQLFARFGPRKGRNDEGTVRVRWQGDLTTTESRVKWYGKGTRSEYRLTRFGRDFPFLAEECVGDLLVLIPRSLDEFTAFVLETDEDVEQLLGTLGVAIHETWGVFRAGEPEVESPDACVERKFREFVAPLSAFPTGEVISSATRQALFDCIRTLAKAGPDEKLLRFVDDEYRLFRMIERQLLQKEIVRPFKDVDDFLRTARSIGNRRMARAGRSLENHVHHILTEAGVPHSMRPRIDGRPDVVIPGEAEYKDPRFPLERLVVMGVKTTCKDRWRQVVREGKRVPTKHLLTLQQGISSAQIQEMFEADVRLVVPASLHSKYPKEARSSLLTLDEFIADVQVALAA